jgi:hypothetical protein
MGDYRSETANVTWNTGVPPQLCFKRKLSTVFSTILILARTTRCTSIGSLSQPHKKHMQVLVARPNFLYQEWGSSARTDRLFRLKWPSGFFT